MVTIDLPRATEDGVSRPILPSLTTDVKIVLGAPVVTITVKLLAVVLIRDRATTTTAITATHTTVTEAIIILRTAMNHKAAVAVATAICKASTHPNGSIGSPILMRTPTRPWPKPNPDIQMPFLRVAP